MSGAAQHRCRSPRDTYCRPGGQTTIRASRTHPTRRPSPPPEWRRSIAGPVFIEILGFHQPIDLDLVQPYRHARLGRDVCAGDSAASGRSLVRSVMGEIIAKSIIQRVNGVQGLVCRLELGDPRHQGRFREEPFGVDLGAAGADADDGGLQTARACWDSVGGSSGYRGTRGEFDKVALMRAPWQSDCGELRYFAPVPNRKPLILFALALLVANGKSLFHERTRCGSTGSSP